MGAFQRTTNVQGHCRRKVAAGKGVSRSIGKLTPFVRHPTIAAALQLNSLRDSPMSLTVARLFAAFLVAAFCFTAAASFNDAATAAASSGELFSSSRSSSAARAVGPGLSEFLRGDFDMLGGRCAGEAEAAGWVAMGVVRPAPAAISATCRYRRRMWIGRR